MTGSVRHIDEPAHGTSTAPTWALTIATYKRGSILPMAVELAASQSCPPIEVIITDASPDWEQTRSHILGDIAPKYPNIRFEYHAASIPSHAIQLNHAISRSAADIVFTFDDDTLMHPGCAEEIISIYAADDEGKIAGIQARDVPVPPPSAADEMLEPDNGATETTLREYSPGAAWKRGIWRFLGRYIFMWDPATRFIPYELKGFPAHPDFARQGEFDVERTLLMIGFKMSFRRAIVSPNGFEPTALSCAGEDIHASYRASKHGLLLSANKALVHHLQTPVGRHGIATRHANRLVHMAASLCRHADNRALAATIYYLKYPRFLFASVCCDLLMRFWTLPTLRGTLRALPHTVRLWMTGDDYLDLRAVQAQERILHGTVKTRTADQMSWVADARPLVSP